MLENKVVTARYGGFLHEHPHKLTRLMLMNIKQCNLSIEQWTAVIHHL